TAQLAGGRLILSVVDRAILSSMPKLAAQLHSNWNRLTKRPIHLSAEPCVGKLEAVERDCGKQCQGRSDAGAREELRNGMAPRCLNHRIYSKWFCQCLRNDNRSPSLA